MDRAVCFTIDGNPLFGVVNQTVFAVLLLATVLWRWFRFAQKQGVGHRRRRPRPPRRRLRSVASGAEPLGVAGADHFDASCG